MKIYYIQYRKQTNESHVPWRETIIAQNLEDLAEKIRAKFVQDQIDILWAEDYYGASQ